MAKLTWGAFGERYFETGIDRGVLYLQGRDGIAWSGLTSVRESPVGGKPTPYYIDGHKYANVATAEEYAATIEAFSAPLEFGVCDGTAEISPGLFLSEQPRRSFSFSYRTRIGNDLDGVDHGYKIHLVYNALAEPTSRAYATLDDSAEANSLSWNISTLPPRFPGRKPTAHLVIDSRRMSPVALTILEGYLYGADGIAPRLPSPARIFSWLQEIEPPGQTVPWQDVRRPVDFKGSSISEITELRNLATNPRGRNTSGTVTIRENLALNGSFENGTFGWSVTGTSSFSSTTNFTGSMWDEERYGGPGREGGTTGTPKHLQMVAEAGRNHFYAITTSAGYVPVTPGQFIGARALVASDLAVAPALSFQYLDATNTVVDRLDGPEVDAGWYKGAAATIHGVVPEGAVRARLVIWGRVRGKELFDGVAQERMWIDDVTVELNNPAPPERYYDGDIWLGDPDFTPEWTGTPRESTSRLVAPRPYNITARHGAVGYYSASRDSYALLVKDDSTTPNIISTNNPLAAADERFSAVVEVVEAPRAVSFNARPDYGGGFYETTPKGGPHNVNFPSVVQTSDTNTYWLFRLAQDAAEIGDTYYFRTGIVPGRYDGPYFDGHTPTFLYQNQEPHTEWEGEPDNSVSIARLLTTIPPNSHHGDIELINGDLYINQDGTFRNYGPIPEPPL